MSKKDIEMSTFVRPKPAPAIKMYQKELAKRNKSIEDYDEDHDRLNEKIDLSDLVMITQYFDKMIDGPRGCLASNCTILKTRRHDRTSILCDFNYKAMFRED